MQVLFILRKSPVSRHINWSLNEQKCSHGCRRNPKPRTTVLARACSKFTAALRNASSPVNFCWSSPAESFLGSVSVCNRDVLFFLFRFTCVLKRAASSTRGGFDYYWYLLLYWGVTVLAPTHSQVPWEYAVLLVIENTQMHYEMCVGSRT
jgi:hypothetical protein